MPKVNGTPLFTGTIGNVIIYKMGDKYYARSKPQVPKETYWKSDSRKRQRENFMEFGIASQVGAKLRAGWMLNDINAFGSYTTGRLNGELYTLLRECEGLRGHRSVQFTKKGYRLEGFCWDKDRNPDHHFTAAPTIKTVNTPQGTKITLQFDKRARHNARAAAAKDTHYAIYLNVVAITDYHEEQSTDRKKDAVPLDPKAEPYTQTTRSAYQPIGTGKNALPDVEMVMDVPHHPEQSLVISYGIKYYHQENGQFTSTNRGNGRTSTLRQNAYMRVLSVTERPSVQSAPPINSEPEPKLESELKPNPARTINGISLPPSRPPVP